MIGAVLGGILSLAGTASTLAAGTAVAGSQLLNTGVRLAGLSYNIGSDIVGATTGLAKGVGKSIGVEPDEPAKDTTGSDEQGKKALPPGVKLNKNGVMVQDRGAKGGGQVLPGQFDDGGNLMSLEDRLGSMEAPDRGDAGPLQQILDYVKVIAANTARTSAGVGMMASNMQSMGGQSNIDDEKPPEQTKPQGTIGKIFGGIGKSIKAVGSSLGKTAKFMIKGLALGGLLYLFLNKQDEVKTAVAGIFEFFHKMYLKIKDSDDPMQLIFDEVDKFLEKTLLRLDTWGDTLMAAFDTFFNEKVMPKLEEMFGVMLEAAKKVAIEFFINTDEKMVREGKEKIQQTTKDFTELKSRGQGADDVDVFKNKKGDFIENAALNDKIEIYKENEGYGGVDGQYIIKGTKGTGDGLTIKLNNMLNDKLLAMKNLSGRTGGRVQFEGFPNMDRYLSGEAIASIEGKSFNQIMNAVPIIDGFISTQEELQNFEADKSAGITKDMKDSGAADQIRKNLARMTEMIHTGSYDAEEFMTLQQQNIKLGQSRESSSALDTINNRTPGITRVTDQGLLNPNNDNVIMPMNRDDVTRLLRFRDKYLRSLELEDSTIKDQPVIVSDSGTKIGSLSTGDTIQMPLGVESTDSTAQAFNRWHLA